MEAHPTAHRYQDQAVLHQGYVFVPGQGYAPVQGHIAGQNLVQTAHGYYVPTAALGVPLQATPSLPRPVSEARPVSNAGSYVTQSSLQNGGRRNLSSAHSMRSIKSTTSALAEILEENSTIFGLSIYLRSSRSD